MKILIDFFPILLFFGAYKFYGIYVGTAVLMGATVAQMALIYAIDRRLQTMHKVTLVLILLFAIWLSVLPAGGWNDFDPRYMVLPIAFALMSIRVLWNTYLSVVKGEELLDPETAEIKKMQENNDAAAVR